MSNMHKYSGRYTTTKISSPEIALEEYLNYEMDNFFPDNGRWSSSCFNKPKDLEICYLPCHLGDNKWLAKMIMNFCNISNSEYKKVLNYVKTSDLFYTKKKEYGLNVVKWQIDFIKNNGEGYHLKEQHGDDFWRMFGDCDKSFRWAIIDTLEDIGMNRKIIEEGLEKYSDSWRNKYMELAFRNAYEPIILNFIGTQKAKEYPKVEELFKKAWLIKRKYDYYKEHRESVDLYGTVTPEMKLTDEQYNMLSDYVKKQAVKRKKEIAEIDVTNVETTDTNEPVIKNGLQRKKKLSNIFIRNNK